MGFMNPDIFEGDMWEVETREGTSFFPCGNFTIDEIKELSLNPDDEVEKVSGWWGRMSASGYLDCTDWTGPFGTEEECMEELENMYGAEEYNDENGDDF